MLFVAYFSCLWQEYVKEKLGEGADERPCIFVFHGGSGSSEEDIATAVKVRTLAIEIQRCSYVTVRLII